MGYEVIGFGNIESMEFTDDELKKVVDILEKINEKFPSSFSNIEVGTGAVSFEMSGNKGIDYEPLDLAKKEILKMGSHPFMIIVGEYMECDGGYYFDTENEVKL